MLTLFGKVSRKLRIDLGLTMKDLADNIGITSSYLSAIEIGKRPLTQELLDKIIKVLAKNDENKTVLCNAAKESITTININLSGKDSQSRDLALSFARRFDNLSSDEMDAVRSLLSKNKGDE